MTRLMRAYWEWNAWVPSRQAAVMARIIVLTVQRIVWRYTGLPDELARRCRDATTPEEAARAALDVRNAYVSSAVRSLDLEDYIDASNWIAKAALRTGGVAPGEIVDLWIEAAEVGCAA